jgi:hypothetical protein
MRPGGVGRADLDPRPDRTREVADHDRRLVRSAETPGELDTLGELERVREDTRHEILLGLGGMPGDSKRQQLVHRAIRIREIDVEGVDRRSECHALIP